MRGGRIAVHPKPVPRKEIVKESKNDNEFWTLDELIIRMPELNSH